MNDYCQVTIDGNYPGTYYVSCESVTDITSSLGNSGTSSISLYSSIGNTDDSYIRISSLGVAQYRLSGSYNTWVDVTGVTSVVFNDRCQFYRSMPYVNLMTLGLVCAACLVKILRR